MNWAESVEDVQIELGLLRQLIDESRELVRIVKIRRDDPTAHLAAGCALQSFYNGVEKILSAIVLGVDGDWDKSDNPRRALLEASARASNQREAIIETKFASQLLRYYEFREAFRYAHFFHLKWEQAAPLVIDLGEMLAVLETQLDEFFRKASGTEFNLADKPAPMPRYWSQPFKIDPSTITRKAMIMSCMSVLVIGLVVGATVVRKFFSSDQAQTIRANVINSTVLDKMPLAFTEPSGQVRHMPNRQSEKSYLVTAGKIVENSREPFTGTLVRKAYSQQGLPVLKLSFHQSQPTFFEAINEKDEFERGYFRDRGLFRYSLCRRDGLPYRTYHLAPNGQTFCMIERGKYITQTGKPPRDGWYYRFYQSGVPAGEIFMTDTGKLLHANIKKITDKPSLREKNK